MYDTTNEYLYINHERLLEIMSRNIIILIVIIAVLGSLAGFIAFQVHRKSVISQGELLFKRGDYQGAIEYLGPKVEGESFAAEERLLVAQSLYRTGEYGKAQEVLVPLLQFGTEDLRALALSGWLFLKQGSYLNAQNKFLMLKDKGNEAEAEAGLAGVALLRSEGRKKNDLNEAEMHLREAIHLDETIPEAYLLLSDLKMLRHDYEGAIDAARKAVELVPHWAEPHTRLGKAYLSADRSKEAEEAFKKAGASELETRFYLGLSLYFQSRFEESLVIFDEISDSDAGIAKESLVTAAKIRLLMGENDAAVKNLKAVVERFKLDPVTGMQLYQIHSRRGETQAGETLLREIVSGWPFVSEAQLEMGNLLLSRGDFKQSYNAYNAVFDTDQTNYWAYYNLGCLSFLRGDIYQAPDYFETSCREFDDFFPGMVNMAMSFLALGRESDALIVLQDLARKYPDNAIILNARALERFHAGYPEVSLQLIQESLNAHPDQPLPFIIRGEVLMRLYQFEEARESFKMALQLDPENIRAQIGMAHSSYRLGLLQEAATMYANLLRRQEEMDSALFTEVRNGNALIQARNAELAAAVNEWETMRSLSEVSRQLAAVNRTYVSGAQPTESDINLLKTAAQEKNPLPEALFNLAGFEEMTDQRDAAAATYKELIVRFESYLPALYNYANLLGHNGQYERAVELYENAGKGNPNRVDLMNNKAVAFDRLSDFDHADQLLQKALDINPNDGVVRFNQFNLALKIGNRKKAESIFTQMKSMAMPINLLRLAEGLLEADRQNWAQAEPLFAAAWEDDKTNAHAVLNHGVALAKLERYTEAEQALRKARDLNPSLPLTHRSLGLLYCHMGLFEEALETLRVSLHLDPTQNDVEKIIRQIQGWQM
jgi:tetratricopeptide (TPR) repeat protein